MTSKSFTITKRIAKHGSQAVIIIPTLLQKQLSHGTLVQILLFFFGTEKISLKDFRGAQKSVKEDF